MSHTILNELQWRGLVHDFTPELPQLLAKRPQTAYAGFDPTAASLHIGNLVPVLLLQHWQRAGHRPIILVGGATGLIGDPSGKKEERKLLSAEQIVHNADCIRRQLERFLDFSPGPNQALLVNNHDWTAPVSLLDFLRDIGKHLTINYMMSKDSVKNRIDTGISFTEFSYQLLQAFDFLHLYRHHGCGVQLGGSDQWGNITSGIELIRRIEGGESHALTAPLLTKSDGSKFGKSESGNVWLDPALTSPYKFYQFWMNQADADMQRLLYIFSLHGKDQLDELLTNHAQAPEKRLAQQSLAEEMTERLHGAVGLASARRATHILFGDSTVDELRQLNPAEIEDIFDGVPRGGIAHSTLQAGLPLAQFLTQVGATTSNSDARNQLKGGAVRLNRQKEADPNRTVNTEDLLAGRFVLVQIGKKKYHLAVVE